MRIVPLIAAIGLLSTTALAGKEAHVYAGHSRAALKLQNDGLAYEDKGDLVNARRCFDEAIRLDSTMWPAYFNRAMLDMKEHKFRQGVEDATMALRGRTDFHQSAVLRALLNTKLGDYQTALHDVDTVISFGGSGNAYPEALNLSAWIRATCPDARYRDGRMAVTQATRACSLTSNKKAGCVDTLAAAYAEVSDFDAAIRIEGQALSLGGTPDEPKDMRRHMHEHMASFKQHRPWRE